MTHEGAHDTEAVDTLRARWETPQAAHVWDELHRLGFIEAADTVDLKALSATLAIPEAPLHDAYKIDLRGIDRRDQVIENGYIQEADISFACFDGALFRKTGPINGVYLVNTRGVRASFLGARFEGWSYFQGATLDEADFSDAVFEDLNVEDCSLQSARFVRADIRRGNLQFANLAGADFTGARVRNLQFGASEPAHLDWKPRHWADPRVFVDALTDAGIRSQHAVMVLGRCQPFDTAHGVPLPPSVCMTRGTSRIDGDHVCAAPEDPVLVAWLAARGQSYDDYVSDLGRQSITVMGAGDGFKLVHQGYPLHPTYRWLGFFDGQDGTPLWRPESGARILHELNGRCGAVFPHPPLESGPASARGALVPEELLPVALLAGGKLSIARTLEEWRDMYVQRGVDWDGLYPSLKERI